MTSPDPNLYLVGFMGTGKSTVGRILAQQTGLKFLDSDHEIERVRGLAVARIFAEEGEAKFRELELAFIEQGHPPHGCIVACGGGLIVPPGRVELLKSRGVVICLHAPIETVLQRTMRTSHRPLLQVENPEARLRQLYAQREEIYRSTGTMVLTDSRSMKEIAAHVMRIYRQEIRPPKK
jgi:shikimate kinase